MDFPAVPNGRYRQRLMSHALASWSSGTAVNWSPGMQVEDQGGDVGTGLIPGEVEERQLAQAGVFQGLDPVLAPAAGTLTGVQERAAPAGELVRNAVIRYPSISSSVGCAPGCNGSARRNRIVPGG